MRRILAFWVVALMILGSAVAVMSSVAAETRDPRDLSYIDESFFQWGPAIKDGSATVTDMRIVTDSNQVSHAIVETTTVHAIPLLDPQEGSGSNIDRTLPADGPWDARFDGEDIVVAWTSDNRLRIQRLDELFEAQYQPVIVTADSSGLGRPSIAISEDGTIHLTYIASKLGSPVAAYTALAPDGAILVPHTAIDVDGTNAVDTRVTLTGNGDPILTVTTATGTYAVSMSRAGSAIWSKPLFGTGTGRSPLLTVRNDIMTAAWISGNDLHWAVLNLQGSLISSGHVQVQGLTGDLTADVDSNGVLHAIVNTGGALEHLGILPGVGLLFQQKVADMVPLGTRACMAIDAWDNIYMVHTDGGLYHRRALTYSFEVTETDVDLLRTLHPDDDALGTITIRNTGGLVDAVGFEAEVHPSSAGWTAQVLMDELYLSKDGEATATVRLEAPVNGGNGDTATLSLALWSRSMPSKVIDVEVPITLRVDYGVDIASTSEIVPVPPGHHEDVTITVTNTGEVDEDIYLTSAATNGPGWSTSLSEAHVILHPGDSTDVAMSVHAPGTATEGQIAIIDVVAMVKEDPDTSMRMPVYALALSDIEVALRIVDQGQTLLPGEATTYMVEVTNNGRSDGEISVMLEVLSGSGDWQAYLADEDVAIAGGATVMVPLTVVAPRDALEGSRFVVRVRASNPRMVGDVVADVTTYVGKVSDIDPTLLVKYDRAAPGDSAHYSFTVTNNGNGLEYINLRSETPFGWEPIRFSIDGVKVKTLPIDVDETIRFDAEVPVPKGTGTGDYDLKIRIIDGRVTDLPIVTHVEMVSDIWLSAAETVREAVDGKAEFNFRIRNYGNGPDMVQLVPEGLPSGWRYEFPDAPDMFLSMVQDKELSFSMKVTVPEDVHEYDIEFVLRARPLTGDGAIVRLLILVLPSDLEITAVGFSTDTFVKGDVEAVTITVRNNGPGPAGRVVVMAEDNGKVFGSEEVTVIRPGSTASVTLTWAVFEGVHDLRFTVDPEDRIYERDEGNNRAEVRVEAKERVGPTPAVPPSVVAGTTLTMTLSIIGIGVASTEWGRFKLLWLFWVPLYTKLKRTGVLDHFVRGQVYGYIKANPGEHYNAIKKALQLKNGTLVYHLQTLEREEYIKSASDGRYKRFYPAGMKVPDEPMRRLNKIQEIILKLIADNPGITQKEIAEEIGLSGATINYHMNVMLRAKVIWKEKVGRKTHMYALDEEEERVALSFSEVGADRDQ